MGIGLLFIGGVYGAAVLVVHLVCYFQQQRGTSKVTRFIFTTKNNANLIEWYLYSLVFTSWLRGRQIKVAVFDDGSTDETLEIARRVRRSREDLEIYESVAGFEEYIRAHQEETLHIVSLQQSTQKPLTTLRW
ncbi:glycosyltransferase family A protein [Paenibacillus residui]|uniref:Glycosyltransferase family A protein n=1 Tax=Paenibacillus residui TaxID=629724 RepID=A0ABW3DE09_9BACL